MLIIPSDNCIQCSLEPRTNLTADFQAEGVEVFYGITKDFSSRIPELEKCLSQDEKQRADRFHFIEDRNTYIACHGLLRVILSEKLNKKPSGIIIVNDKNNKPCIAGNPIYFNITHVRDAFAFVISRYFYVGIDMEDVERSMDFVSIIDNYFSKKEREYIMRSKESKDRFLLLWTRKEAFLKAIGIGIIESLSHIEVSENENIIYKKSLDNLLSDSVYYDHFIYSKRVLSYYLSVAVHQRSKVVLIHLKEEIIKSCGN